MFRYTILTAILALATGFAFVPEAGAQPLVTSGPGFVRPGHHVHYKVFVRHRGHWDFKGTYHSAREAYRAARILEFRGYDTRVVRDYR